MNPINQIYCGDCLKFMKDISDKSIDLVLTDPPYGINIAKSGKVGGKKLAKVKDYGICSWDNQRIDLDIFNEIFRISKNQIIFGGNYYTDFLYPSSCWIVWDKNNSGNFADCELAWTSFNTAVKKYKFTWNGMLQENMKHKEERYHPTQKPIELFYRILRDYSNENDLILDPFIGSGTTAAACKKLGRNFIGMEIEPKYVDIANKRIADIKQQLTMAGVK